MFVFSGSWISLWTLFTLQWRWTCNTFKSPLSDWSVSTSQPSGWGMGTFQSICPLAAALAIRPATSTKPLWKSCSSTASSSMARNWNWCTTTLSTQGTNLQMIHCGSSCWFVLLSNYSKSAKEEEDTHNLLCVIVGPTPACTTGGT